MALLKNAADSASWPLARSALPKLKAFSASREEVVASSMGVSNFSTDLIDSPSSPRNCEAALPSATRTFNLGEHELPPLERFLDVVEGEFVFPKVAVHGSQSGVSHREIRIELNGSFEKCG